jgi:non-ribosomal peptide synthetase component F
MFALLHEKTGPQQTGFGGLEMVRLSEHNDTAQLDLTLYMYESGGALTAGFEYATDLFTAATVDWMLARFEELLAAATADPDRRLSALPPERWLASQSAGGPETAPAEPESRLQALQESVEERRSRLSDEARALLARRLRGRSP